MVLFLEESDQLLMLVGFFLYFLELLFQFYHVVLHLEYLLLFGVADALNFYDAVFEYLV